MVKRWVIAQPTSYSGVAMYPASEVQTCGPEYVLASDYDALRSRLADIESQNSVMWDVANDREARLAEVEEELAQWQATGESVTRNEHDIAARLAEAERDSQRLDWLERWITDNSGGFEIYPIGPEEEYGPDGNTVIGVTSWTLADKQWPVSTMREAIDLAMQADGERENARE